ncbi:hypothetical protein GCM10009665_54260 [Kitasatospora nipponensis]|uniref:SUKH-3 immunity protein of toxin-antitoxin system n=1 Tax=Kitasatospora nipponensis TaxID=258049 RepID=A0ABN1WQJ7_9ACTN
MTPTPPSTEPLDDADDDADDDSPWIIASCPVSAELAAQIVGMAEVDWVDPEVAEHAMLAAGWRSTGSHLGEFGETGYTPAGHLVYGEDCFSMPFAYQYWVHPEGAVSEDHWGVQPGWHSLVDPPVGGFTAQLDAVVGTFTALLGPPDHDVSHPRRPGSDYLWRYRAWRRGDRVLAVAPGLDGFSYAQFEHLVVQIRSLPAGSPFPPAAELPDFFR